MQGVVAVIGGTGVGERLRELGGHPLHVPTQFGLLKGRRVSFQAAEFLAISRHSTGHKVPPHAVNYAAMAAGLKQLGISWCFSTAAVGSLREDWLPGTMAICTDFLDLSARNLTLFERQVVHTDFSEPFSKVGIGLLRESAHQVGIDVRPSAIYLNGNGPRYETPGEINLYRRMGAEVVGMTAASEAIAMREAGIHYACLAVVTNLACGMHTDPLTHEEVVEMMQVRGPEALQILAAAARGVFASR